MNTNAARLVAEVEALRERVAYLEGFVIELSKRILGADEVAVGERMEWKPPLAPPTVEVTKVPGLDATGFLAEQRLREWEGREG